MVDIELPSEIQELVDNYDDNCREIENQAVNILYSIEHPIFSFLRDLTAQKSHFVLSRLRDWFGTTPTKHHCLCLMMLTDFISCAYNNTDFYGTFVKEKQDKFYGSFFSKLFNEWKVLFYRMPITVLPMDQFTSLKNNLSVSIARFPNRFAYKGLLTDIMTSCEEYGTRLEKHISDLKAQQKFNINVDILKNPTPVLSSKSNTVLRVISDSKSTSNSIPFKVKMNPSKIPAAILNSAKTQLAKRQSPPEPKKVNFNAALSKSEVKPPPVIVIDDSPVKSERTSLKLDNITNTVSSKALKRPAESCVLLKPLNLDGKLMKFQNDVTVSNNVTKASPQQKLNAFDILMRRKSIKTIS